MIRGFAPHLHALDPAHELVPRDLLPQRPRRAVPYLYSDAEIRALMGASCVISTPHRAATMRALIGLFAVTGMRIGEAIRLNQADIDHQRDALTVVERKFGKSRELAVHASTTAALRAYLARRDRPVPPQPIEAVFTSAVGTRLSYCNVHSQGIADRRLPGSPRARARQHDPHPQHAPGRDPLAVSLRRPAPSRARHHDPTRPGHPDQANRPSAGHLPHRPRAQIYLHADLAIKENALARTTPPTAKPGRYQPTDRVLAFLDAL